ncbi:MAG: hypothetical protein R6U61_05175 [Thermoplasmata archaeon]
MSREKTKTIKKRAIYVYTPSEEMAQKWKEIADEREQSTSNFVVEMVEDGLAREEEENFESRPELIKQKSELKEELTELTKENRRLKTLIDKQEKELQEYRSKDFLDDDFEGARQYSVDLVNLLKDKGKVRYEDIHPLLGIDAGSDASIALQRQIEELEKYGLIEHTDRYLKWRG